MHVHDLVGVVYFVETGEKREGGESRDDEHARPARLCSVLEFCALL